MAYSVIVYVLLLCGGSTGSRYLPAAFHTQTVARSNATIPDFTTSERNKTAQEVVIAVVACGNRSEQALTLLKTCLLFSRGSPKRFIVITDAPLVASVTEELLRWKLMNVSFQFEVIKGDFPEKDREEWRQLYKPCATQRLFLPTLLPHVDSLVYMDVDTLFLSPVEDLWEQFVRFNSTQMMALALHHEDPKVSWYTRHSKQPYYGQTGVNAGVMLMNLTRLRSFRSNGMGWDELVASVFRSWRGELPWGDESILNIVLHQRGERVRLLNCAWNYRPEQCGSCAVAGVRVLHGSLEAFRPGRQPVFRAVYEASLAYQPGADPVRHFLQPLLHNLEQLRLLPVSNCSRNLGVFTQVPISLFGKQDRQS